MEKFFQQKETISEGLIDMSIASNATKYDDLYSVTSAISLYMKELEDHPVLTLEEERELAIQILNGNNEAKEKFIISNLRLVVYVAKKYSFMQMELLDLIQEGNLGLLKAVDMFDHTKGVRFSTYAIWWIKRAILKFLGANGNLIRLPDNIQGLIRKYYTIQSDFYQKNMCYATDFEISAEMKISVEEVEELKSFIYNTTSLNEPVNSESDLELGDFIQDTNATPEQAVLDNFGGEIVDELITNANLTEKEETLIRKRFDFENDVSISLEEIAKEMGITKEKARLIEARAMRKLRGVAPKYKKEIFM